MPVAILKFKLPEEESEHVTALRAGEFLSALCEIDNRLRNELKHGGHDEKTASLLSELRALVPNVYNDGH